MKDFFTEQLVKHNISPKDNKLRGIFMGVYIALIIYILFSFAVKAGNADQIGIFLVGLFIAAAVGYIGFLQISGYNVEFEYTYTNGILDVDVIRNRSRRKTIFSAGVGDFELMAHITDNDHLSQYKDLPAVDFSSGEIKDNTYVFITVHKGNKKRFILEPKEELLNAMLTDLTPRRLFIKK